MLGSFSTALVQSHIDYCRARDAEFRATWTAVGRRCGIVANSIAITIPPSLRIAAAHNDAVLIASALIAPILNRDFAIAPDPKQWIRAMHERKLVRLAAHWKDLFCRGIRTWAPCKVMIYGGTKCMTAVQRIWSVVMRQGVGVTTRPLDLWDAVRFRIVTPNLRTLQQVVANLVIDMKYSLIRCRNYYTHPRGGPCDPYRAVHMEFCSDQGEYVELQVCTDRREAVGHLDHALICKKRIPFGGLGHRKWLQRLSWMANILDARDFE